MNLTMAARRLRGSMKGLAAARRFHALNAAVAASLRNCLDENLVELASSDRRIVDALDRAMGDARYRDQAIDLVRNYVGTLTIAVRNQNDHGREHPSIELFTRHALRTGPSPYHKDRRAEYLAAVAFLNTTANRLQSATLVFDYASFDDYNFGLVVDRLFSQPSGMLSLPEKVIPWLNRTPEFLAGLERELESDDLGKAAREWRVFRRRTHLARLAKISAALDVDVPGLTEGLRAELANSRGTSDSDLLTLAGAALEARTCADAVETWLDSLPEGERRAAHDELRVDGSQTALDPDYPAPDDAEDELRNLRRMVVDRSLTRDFVQAEASRVASRLDAQVKAEHDLGTALEYARLLLEVRHMARYVNFYASFAGALDSIQGKPQSSVLYVYPEGYSLVNGCFSLPVFMEAKRRGAMVGSVSPRTMNWNGIPVLGLIDQDIDLRGRRQVGWHRDWKIDIPNRAITSGPYNIYQPIYEFCTRYQFGFTLNYESDAWARAKTRRMIGYMDSVITYCEELAAWARSTDTAIRFVSNASHFPMIGAYRIFCEAVGYRDDVEFIQVVAGYDNYFKNLGDQQTETLTALNLTRHPDSRSSFLGTREGFAEYTRKHRHDVAAMRSRALEWMSHTRIDKTRALDSAARSAVMERIQEAKRSGKRIYLALGKVVFDHGVKTTEGCCHSDMQAWIQDTVTTAGQCDDVLLLVKPHPHERLRDLTMTSEPLETFRDLIAGELPANVVYLDNDAFSLWELIDEIDLALLWNGTSSLELGAWGVPTVVCDSWAHKDYPVGFLSANTLDEYHSIIRHGARVPAGVQEACILFLNYMASPDVAVPNHLTSTTTLNYNQFTASRINEDAVSDFRLNGDASIAALFDRLGDDESLYAPRAVPLDGSDK